jgi:hypothetical protein
MFSHRDDTTPYDELVEKWNPLLEHDSLEPIGDYYKKKVTAVLLENQQTALREQAIHEQANVMGGGILSYPQAAIKLETLLVTIQFSSASFVAQCQTLWHMIFAAFSQ